MKFLILVLISSVPSVGICFLLLKKFEIFRTNDVLLYIAVLISFCLIFFIMAKIFHLK
jgi:ABC-type nitrate/sulfonate/bicarbonate transport system permease component